MNIIQIAEEAGFKRETTLTYGYPYTAYKANIERFAALVAAHEREKQAKQEPVAWFVQYKNRHEFVFGNKPEFIVDGVVEPLYAAPVRTKDLTDDEIYTLYSEPCSDREMVEFARAVIAADREKNRG